MYHPSVLPFCEDFATIPDSTLIVLSCDSARKEWSHLKNQLPAGLRAGELHLYDPQSPTTLPLKLTVPVADFRPLGISAVRLPDGRARLFVANQAFAGATVEVVDVELTSGATTHAATVADALIQSPNGIAAVSPTGFFVTNDLYFARKSLPAALLEVVLGIAGGTLVHVELTAALAPKNATRVARIAFANGVVADPATRRLWVAGMLSGVYEYVWDGADAAALTTVDFARSAMLADNLVFSEATGGVYVSGVASVKALGPAFADPDAARHPSLTAELLPRLVKGDVGIDAARRGADIANKALRTEEWRWATVFADSGSVFSGATSGAVLQNGRFVATGLLSRGVVVCKEAPGRPALKAPVAEKSEL